MKKLLLIQLILFSVIADIKATEVSGLIMSNTTWAISGSPFIVTGNILITEGATLTIEPGVRIQFNESKSIQVNGGLVARGNETDSIVFTSNTGLIPGAWGSIYFTSNSIDAVFDANGNYLSGSAFEYCVIEYGGVIEDNEYADMLLIEEACPFIQHSSFKNAKNTAIRLEFDYGTAYEQYSLKQNFFTGNETGIYILTLMDSVFVTNCTFTNNECGIFNVGNIIVIEENIFSSNYAAIDIRSFAIVNNNEFSYNVGKEIMGIEGFIIHLPFEVKFTNNLCQHNLSSLLNLGTYGKSEVKMNVISDNSSEESGYLIYLGTGSGDDNDSLYIENNIITHNSKLQPLYLETHANHVTLTSNTINHNYVESELITAINNYDESFPEEDTSKIIFNDNVAKDNYTQSGILMDLSGVIELNENSICQNTCIYIIKNSSSPTSVPYIDIDNNYWNVETVDELNVLIYDFFDDANLGITQFGDILLAPAPGNPVLPPSNVEVTHLGNNRASIRWDPNPEENIEGYIVYWGNYSSYQFDHFIDAGLNTTFIIEGVNLTDGIAVTAYNSDYVPGKRENDWLNENMLLGHESAYSFELQFPVGNQIFPTETAITVYPVPSDQKVTLEISAMSDFSELSLLNPQGKSIFSQKIESLQTEIDLSRLPAGIYLVRLKGSKGISTKKIFKI